MIELLADSTGVGGADRLREINHYLNRSGGDPWYSLIFWLVAMSLITVLLLAALRYARWQRRHQRLGRPWRLFSDLLSAFPLTWSQRRLLARVAGGVCPDAPAAILLTRTGLTEAIRRWSANQPAGEWARVNGRLTPVFDALFQPPDEAPAE